MTDEQGIWMRTESKPQNPLMRELHIAGRMIRIMARDLTHQVRRAWGAVRWYLYGQDAAALAVAELELRRRTDPTGRTWKWGRS